MDLRSIGNYCTRPGLGLGSDRGEGRGANLGNRPFRPDISAMFERELEAGMKGEITVE